jgi:hypothetical protein
MHYSNPQFEEFYNEYSRKLWLEGSVDSINHAVKRIFVIVARVVYFFMWPELCVPLVALPWFLWDHRIRFFLIQIFICFSGMLLVPWSQAHYAAPLTAALIALLMQAIRHLRQFQLAGRPVGIGLSRVIVLSVLLLGPFHPHVEPLGHPAPAGIEYRALFERKLTQIPGEHLVIVRYAKGRHGLEWVYNAADIDHAKVVWAREIPGMDMQPLLNYFQGHRMWVVEPDSIPPRITPYVGAPPP